MAKAKTARTARQARSTRPRTIFHRGKTVVVRLGLVKKHLKKEEQKLTGIAEAAELMNVLKEARTMLGNCGTSMHVRFERS